MLCRLLLGAVFLLYLVCVLILSGLQKDDLEVGLLKKLEHYNIDIGNAINNVTVLEDCLTTVHAATNTNFVKSTAKPNTSSTNIKTETKQDEPDLDEIVEIDFDSDTHEIHNNKHDDSSKIIKQHKKIKPKTVHELLKIWESFKLPNPSEQENINKDTIELDKQKMDDDNNMDTSITTTISTIAEHSDTQTTEMKYNKKDVEDYISKQFAIYFANATNTRNVVTKTKRIAIKVNKLQNKTKILIDSKGVKEYSFVNKAESTSKDEITSSTPKMSTVDNKLVLSDSIIDRIAKSVKTMVIEDLRKELQPLKYHLNASTTVKNPEVVEPVTVAPTETTTASYYIQVSESTTTAGKVKILSCQDKSDHLFSHPLKQEHLQALEKFLEIFGLQHHVTTTSTEHPITRMNSYPAPPQQSFSNPVNYNNVEIKNEPGDQIKEHYNVPMSRNQYPPYNQPPNNEKQKLVFTLQSDIHDIPPLRVPTRGHVYQNIIVSTKSPGGSFNDRQRWWKPRNRSYPMNIQASRYTRPPQLNSESESDFPTLAPIRLSKGKKMWGPPSDPDPSDRFRQPLYNWRQEYYKNKKPPKNGAKFHELLEFGSDYKSDLARPHYSRGETHDGMRLLKPLTHKKTYNEAPFQKIMQTQEKVNKMLERILEMNKYATEGTRESRETIEVH